MHIDFIDQTLRDGQQSLWGLKMQAHQAADALPHLAQTGYRTIDLTGPGMFTVLTRDFADDPWDATDFLVRGLSGNNLRQGMRTNSVMGFSLAPDAIIDLWAQTLIKHGVNEVWMYDCAYDMPVMERFARAVASAGGTPIPTVMYGLTSVHDDAFFANRAREMASWDVVDTIEVEDAPGILSPERAKTLLPAIREAVPDKYLELHCHTNTGLAQLNYMAGIEAGFNAIHTASRPMANGPSLPSTEQMVDIVEYMGHIHSLDANQFAPVAENFEREARLAGYLTGTPVEFNPRAYDHQLPGGMTGTLLKQLEKHDMVDRFPDVLREIPNVRRALGEPIMATPFSQFVGIQAVLNVITGDPYSIVPDEVIHYLLGHYGPIQGPIDANICDRILSTDRAKTMCDWRRPNQTLGEIREKFGRGVSDEELILRFMNSKEEVDLALANGPVRKDPRRSSNAIVDHVIDLIGESASNRATSVRTPEFRVSLN